MTNEEKSKLMNLIKKYGDARMEGMEYNNRYEIKSCWTAITNYLREIDKNKDKKGQ